MNQANTGQPAITTLTAKPGDKVDNYTLMEQIGTGGTAVVFRAHDHVLNRDVAIKQIIVPAGDSGDEIRQRAVAEAQSHKRVATSDPKLLVQFVDIINDSRGLFLISELIDGPSLEAILQKEPRPMDQRQALGIVAATAKALDAVHKHGMVHRDLKPSNILMPREGGLKLADFGLAAVVSEQQAMDVGSVRYMSPETLKGEPATAKSDLYSLGVVAYEMLAGREKFDEAFRTILRDQRNQAMRWVKWHTNTRAKATPLTQLVPGIPESLSGLVERMMEKDPARRVGSATELLEAIRTHFAGGNNGQATPTPKAHAGMSQAEVTDVSATAAVPQRSKIPFILAGMLVIWGVAIGGFFVWQGQQEAKQLEAKITEIHDDLIVADRLHFAKKYDEAAAAFAAIPDTHGLSNPDSYLYELCQAGVLRSEGMLAIEENSDFVTAVDKFEQYGALALDWSDEQKAKGPDVKLSHEEAARLTDNNRDRKLFQQIVIVIQQMMDDGDLEGAKQEIQRQRDRSPAEEDLATLNALEAERITRVETQRIERLLTEVDRLIAENEMREAIDLLEKERKDKADRVDSRVAEQLAALLDKSWEQENERRIRRARSGNDRQELLAALRERQTKMPSDEIATEIREIEIQVLLDRASAALAANEPDRAQKDLEDVLEIAPDNEQAKRMLARIEGKRMQLTAIASGDRFLAEANYPKAIESYKAALEHGPDLDGQINAKIQVATGQIAKAAAEDALDAGELDTAQSKLNDAIAALGTTADLQALQARIDAMQVYRDTVAQGDDLFENGEYGSAKRRYLAAQEMFDSDAIRQKIRMCNFKTWMVQCDQAIAQRNWIDAESALKQAEAIEVNDETRSRRQTIENRVQ